MARRIRFGVRLPAAGPLASASNLRHVAREAEELAYDHVWVHDYIDWSRELDRKHISCGSVEARDQAGVEAAPHFLESVTNLAYLAGVTSKIRIGTSVLALPWRHPVILARQLANIDCFSEGRLIVGVGAGASRASGGRDFEILEIPRKGKFARTREHLLAMRGIWTDETSSFAGDYIDYVDASVFPKPVTTPHPPIWIGGSGPSSMSMAAELGNGLMPGFTSPAAFGDLGRRLRTLLANHDKDPSGFELVASVPTCLARNAGDAQDHSRKTTGLFAESYSRAPNSMDEVLASCLVGSPSEVLEKIMEYVQYGVTQFELRYIYHSIPHLLEQMALFASEVRPRLDAIIGSSADIPDSEVL